MKIDVEDLFIYPANKSMALDHLRACQDTKQNLGDFLDWGKFAPEWNLKQHLGWVRISSDLKIPYQSNAIYWEDQLVGMFDLVEAVDGYGLQFLYWVRGNYQGNGIAKTVTEILSERVFIAGLCDYIEIHVDVANIPSQKVPKSLGFEIDETYQMAPLGSKGTGEMNVWVKLNPYFRKVRPEPEKRIKRVFGWSQKQRWIQK